MIIYYEHSNAKCGRNRATTLTVSKKVHFPTRLHDLRRLYRNLRYSVLKTSETSKCDYLYKKTLSCESIIVMVVLGSHSASPQSG